MRKPITALPEDTGQPNSTPKRHRLTLGSFRRRSGLFYLACGAALIAVGYFLTKFSEAMSDDGFDIFIGAFIVGGLFVVRGLYEIVGSSFTLPGVPWTGSPAALATVEKGYLVAAASGLALLIAMSALSWFSVVDTGGNRREVVDDLAMNAWEGLEYLDGLLFVVAAFALAVFVSRKRGGPIKFKFATNSQILFAAALLSAIFLVLQALNPRDPSADVTGYERYWAYESGALPGVWIGVVLLIAVAVGGWMARADSGVGAPASPAPPAS